MSKPEYRLLDIPGKSAVEAEIRHAQMASCLARNLPRLEIEDAPGVDAVFVCYGPSLKTNWEEIRDRQAHGAHVITCSGAHDFLVERGVIPDAHIDCDPRRHKVDLLNKPQHGTQYWMASVCHPEFFDKLFGYDVRFWHVYNKEETERWVKENDPSGWLLTGGTMIGGRGIGLIYHKGYRVIHVYGMDGSYDAEGRHAGPHTGSDQARMKIRCGTRSFESSGQMVNGARDIVRILGDLARFCDITFHGDGLAQQMIREATGLSGALHADETVYALRGPLDPDIAVYDFASAPATWDFLVWLVNAEMERRFRGGPGPLKVRFLPGPNNGFRERGNGRSHEEQQKLFDHVIRPSLELFGAEEISPDGVRGHRGSYALRGVSDKAREGVPVPRWTAPPEALATVFWALRDMRRPVSLTLREARYSVERNSDPKAWVVLAKQIKADGYDPVIVRDTATADTAPLDPGIFEYALAARDLHIRAALYQRCAANLYTSNGPIGLGMFSRQPWLLFRPLNKDYVAGTEKFWTHHMGVEAGEQFPWASSLQRIIWDDGAEAQMLTAWHDLKTALDQSERKVA